jgi:cation:H+ antiporter
MAVWGLLMVLGVVLLIVGSDLAIDAASRVARSVGISELVVGLTIVAIGTSLPELATTMAGSIAAGDVPDDAAGMAIGNIVGSNVFMLTALLGLSGVVRDLPVKAGSLKREGVVLTAFTLVLLVPFAMGRAERWFGVVCVLAYAAFVWRVIVEERRQTQLDLPLPEDDEEEEEEDAPGWAMRLVERIPIPPLGQQGVLVTAGLGLVVGGAALVVNNGVAIAQALAISGTVIGVFVGATTSLPEVVVSVRAANRGSTDIAVGNILGSSITNVGLCLGVPVIFAPLAIGAQVLTVDYPFLVAATLIALLLMANGDGLTRKEGGSLLVLFALYLVIRVGVG